MSGSSFAVAEAGPHGAPVASPAPRQWRPLLALGLAGLAVVVIFILSVALGAVRLSPGEVLDGLLGRGEMVTDQIIRNVRLPRALLALVVGANLAVAGLLLQNVTRNPLADPQILGFSAAGALAAVLATVRAPDLPVALLPPISIGGALAGAALVFAAAWSGGTSPVRLALAGVMVASLFTSFTALLLVTSDLTTQAALGWVSGGLFGRGWGHWHAVWPYAVGGGLLAVLLVRDLNILALGEEHARSLGLRVERTRLYATALAAGLTGSAVAISGQIAFVGLLAPHAARLLVGSDARLMLPMSALLGAAVLGGSDIVSRVLIAPTEIPIGVVTAALGVPLFLALLRRQV
jgi:iron complex transport system permease protein